MQQGDRGNSVRFEIAYWRYKDLPYIIGFTLAVIVCCTMPNHWVGHGDIVGSLFFSSLVLIAGKQRLRVWYWWLQGCLVEVNRYDWSPETQHAVIDLRKRKDKQK